MAPSCPPVHRTPAEGTSHRQCTGPDDRYDDDVHSFVPVSTSQPVTAPTHAPENSMLAPVDHAITSCGNSTWITPKYSNERVFLQREYQKQKQRIHMELEVAMIS